MWTVAVCVFPPETIVTIAVSLPYFASNARPVELSESVSVLMAPAASVVDPVAITTCLV